MKKETIYNKSTSVKSLQNPKTKLETITEKLEPPNLKSTNNDDKILLKKIQIIESIKEELPELENLKKQEKELQQFKEEVNSFKPTKEQKKKLKELKKLDKTLHKLIDKPNIKKKEETRELNNDFIIKKENVGELKNKNNESNNGNITNNTNNSDNDSHTDGYTDNYTDDCNEKCELVDILGIIIVVLTLILFTFVCANYREFETPMYDYLYKFHILSFPVFLFVYYLTLFRPTRNYFSRINNSDNKYTLFGGIYTYFYIMIQYLGKLD